MYGKERTMEMLPTSSLDEIDPWTVEIPKHLKSDHLGVQNFKKPVLNI